MPTSHAIAEPRMKPATLRPRVMNEYGRLRDVVASRGATVVNGREETDYLERFSASRARPQLPRADWDAERVRAQHDGFLRLLSEQGVRVHHPREIGGAIYSLFTRDVGFVVHDLFVHARMADRLRTWERYALTPILEGLSEVIEPDEGVVEGGDIIVHGNTVFVGITNGATDEHGFDALRRLLSPRGIRVVPIHCRESVPHLDQRLAVLGPQTALIHRAELDPLDVLYLEAEFNLIDVPKEELDSLGANVLAIAPDAVVIDARHVELRRRLRKERIEPLPVAYDEVTKMRGSFHCTTLPLVRDAM